MLTPIPVKELSGNIFSLYDDGWALVTARDGQAWNTMTISWGACGWLWSKPVCITYVRESRYTRQFLDKSAGYSVSFFAPEDCREQLRLLGSRSGRDMDKMKDSGLTPIELDGEIAFEEARSVVICRTLYVSALDPANLRTDEVLKSAYSGPLERDFHRAYTAEIVSAYQK